MKSKLAVLLIAFLYIYIFFNRLNDWRDDHVAFQWDKSTYYAYLPAVFIYHDLAHLSFYEEMNKKYHFTGDDSSEPPGYKQPNGRMLDKYPVGTAIMEAPFFFIAHAYTKIVPDAPADGFSFPYQQAIAFSNMFWVIMGLILMQNVLRRYFTDVIITITLLCIALGTNLYHYTVFYQGLSHPISIFLLAALLYLTVKLYETQRNQYFYLLAFTLALITLVRPVNIIAGIIPLLWGVYNAETFKQRLLFFKKHLPAISIGFLIFSLFIFVQLAYWKYITGHWVYYSYEGEGFNLPYSKVIKGLFSYQKGWFLYTPIALIAMLGLIKTDRKYRLTLVLFFALMVYITFSWKQWWYGWGFGCRPLVDTYAIMGLPLAAIFTYVYRHVNLLAVKIGFSVLLVFFIALNVFQTYQYSLRLIHGDRMTKTYYWKVFGKLKHEENMDPYIVPADEFNKDKE